jgi:hypothetical protein
MPDCYCDMYVINVLYLSHLIPEINCCTLTIFEEQRNLILYVFVFEFYSSWAINPPPPPHDIFF